MTVTYSNSKTLDATMMKTATFLVLLLFSFTVTAELYSFELGDFVNPKISPPGQETFRHRLLQDGAACGFKGDKLVCDHAYEVDAGTGDMITVQFHAICDADAQVKFNYQRAANCQCNATVSTKDGKPPKTCPCTICQAGFGDLPVTVDCTNYEEDDTDVTTPYIVGTCTSLDCGAVCNGTCERNCTNAGADCPYCTTETPSTAPTSGPPSSQPASESSSSSSAGSSVRSSVSPSFDPSSMPASSRSKQPTKTTSGSQVGQFTKTSDVKATSVVCILSTFTAVSLALSLL
jgi:hypothetical protein